MIHYATVHTQLQAEVVDIERFMENRITEIPDQRIQIDEHVGLLGKTRANIHHVEEQLLDREKKKASRSGRHPRTSRRQGRMEGVERETGRSRRWWKVFGREGRLWGRGRGGYPRVLI